MIEWSTAVYVLLTSPCICGFRCLEATDGRNIAGKDREADSLSLRFLVGFPSLFRWKLLHYIETAHNYPLPRP